MRESTIERYLVRRVKALGGEVRKVTWQGRRGAPDRLVMLPPLLVREVKKPGVQTIAIARDALSCWVELKAPGEKPEPHQKREHERLRKVGQRVVVIDSIEGVDALLA